MTTAAVEQRALAAEEVEYSASEKRAAGYGAVFNIDSGSDAGQLPFVEQFAVGAFSKTLAEQDVRCLFNHDANYLLGRTSSGTLRLGQDERGLRYEVDLPDTQQGHDVATLLERRDMTGSSIGFIAHDVDWQTTPDGEPLRIIRAAQLVDCGPVTFPAYPSATVALRNLAGQAGIDLKDVQAAAEAGDLPTVLDHIKELSEHRGDSVAEDITPSPPVLVHRIAR